MQRRDSLVIMALMVTGFVAILAQPVRAVQVFPPNEVVGGQFLSTPSTIGSLTDGAVVPLAFDKDYNLRVTSTGGTGTSNQGTPNTAANAWPVKVTDGTNVAAVKAASTSATATDPAVVVALSPNNGLGTGTAAIGTVSLAVAYVGSDVNVAVTSVGTTRVVIAAPQAGKTIWVRGQIRNLSATTAYTLYPVNTTSGHALPPLGPIPAGGTGWWQVGDAIHSEQGDGLSFTSDAGAGANLVGVFTYQAN